MDMISAEEVRDMLNAGHPVRLIDVRPQHYVMESREIIEGAIPRDAERVGDWISELPRGIPVVTICAYGRSIGIDTAAALREAGIDARCMVGGHAAWKAIDGGVVPIDEGYR